MVKRPDTEIWQYARQHGFAILTADADFVEIASRLGPPPRIVRLLRMNYRTRFALALLQSNAIRISEFGLSDQPVLILRLQ